MALEASPRQQPAIPPDAFPVDAPPRHHYIRQPSPPRGDDFQQATSPRSPSGPRPARSNNGRSNPTTPLQAHRSPVLGSGSSGSTARPVTISVSPRLPAGTGSGSGQRDQTTGDRQIDGAIVAPPRTSSHQRAATASGPTDFHLPDRTRSRSRGDAKDDAAESARARRDIPISPIHSPSSPSGNRLAPTSGQARSGGDAPSRPAEMSRDNSQVLNRVVVTDPEVDRTREKERLAESVPVRDDGRTATSPRDDAQRRSQPPPAQRSRQDFSATASSSKRKETRFGDYILGQTLGEGEFGKVKLGWKKDGSVEVAIKLIRRENLNSNPSRLPKIYREIAILQGLSHPNIVRLHEMVETERHIGIILEYASGGELFDYILTHRYLKDPAARRLFAQLVSGVGYLHKKGIVHRDLKLENLLLDRNRNIIITDFGFANTFNPRDELGEDIESNLGNRDFVKRMNLDRLENGHRRGDLMQTSCGSPCYAAPELVVTDSLYTGRKVDVWSCGVILYAMLAGYLPFDDDPANPEGDNINLLYKYIVSTPLTFPEYVTPHARDLLRRILVPDPRKRADLFEVARHSWLAEYAHVVAHVTSTTTSLSDLANMNLVQDDPPSLARSASVREPTKPHSQNMSPVGGFSRSGKSPADETTKSHHDPKRRTVQVEYVAPQSKTARGEMSPPTPQAAASARSPDSTRKSGSKATASSSTTRKPLPQSPSEDRRARDSRRQTQQASDPSRVPRSVSDSTSAFGQQPATSIARPNTGGSMSSNGGGRLPSRGNSYGQPVAPTVAATNAQGNLTQPKVARNYNISAPVPHDEPQIPDNVSGRPISQRVPSNRNSVAMPEKGHKRANTFGNVFGRSGSLFGGNRTQPQSPGEANRPEKRYPPASMRAPATADDAKPRPSGDQRRPSFGFSRKNSDVSKPEKEQKSRRFSLLPASFSLKSMGQGGKGDGRQADDRPGTQPTNYTYSVTTNQDGRRIENAHREHARHASAPIKAQGRPPRSAPHPDTTQYPPTWRPGDPGTAYPYGEAAPTESNNSFAQDQGVAQNPGRQPSGKARYPQGFNEQDQEPQGRPSTQGRTGRVLHKPNRKFVEAWDRENEGGHHAGSSGAARRVMDFFRRRGKARAGEER